MTGRLGAILLIAILCILMTCEPRNPMSFLNDSNVIQKSRLCDPDKPFPQMVIIPFFNRATHIVNHCDVYPTSHVAMSLLIFHHMWSDYFGDSSYLVKDMLEKVMIEWGDEMKVAKRGYDINGIPFVERKVIGLAMSSSYTWIYAGSGRRMSETSLFHELVHLAIRAQNGVHGDPDHEGNKYEGWTPAHTDLIIKSKDMLRAFGF